jgi:protein-S-isoprenylcysteine O-methyltransferase Ste14
MTISGSRAVAYLVFALTALLGWASMLAFVGFLLFGSPDLVDLHFADSGTLWFDTGLCLAFFVQHSGMIRRSFRRRLARVLHERYVAAVFTISSAVLLLALVVSWQGSSQALVAFPLWCRWLLRAVSVASMAGIVWGVLALKAFDAFGVGPIRDYLRGSKTPPLPFTVRGPYRWVRHPLYFFFLVMFWAYPDLTIDRLIFNGLWTVWMIVGTVLEERDLVAAFGETYRDYQRRVPMLIPWRILPAPASQRSENGKP